MSNLKKSVAFIGFKSSGKTTLGRLCAQKMNCAFIDTDEKIEAFHPEMLCREIAKRFGESYFRKMEDQVIAAIPPDPPVFIASGGGSIANEINAKSLKSFSVLIYLKTSIEIIQERIIKTRIIPSYLQEESFSQSLEKLYNDRVQLYEKWADATLEMDALTPELACGIVEKKLKQLDILNR